MKKIEERKAGENLAKVLWYYNLFPDGNSSIYKIVCPFHKDVNPSLLVDLNNGSWFCFGCNRSGDAISFVKFMEQDKMNDLQSLKKYFEILKSKKCSKFKISVRRKSVSENKEESRALYAQAYDYYHGLKSIDWKTIEDDEGKELKLYMNERGFSDSTLNRIKAKMTYNKNYGIIFPMLDNGKFKGWVCRTTVKEIESKRKYLYNEGFKRSRTLVGDYGKYDYVFVVEGFMDRLKFLQFGYSNVVAVLGWKMSDEQIKKLKNKGIKKVISALDNDECGRKGTSYLKRFFEVERFCYLKGIKDPGEMTKENFTKMFNKTMNKLKES